MRASRFDQSKVFAFVQSPCFARNNPQGFRIYCGQKKWRGLFRWPRHFRFAQPNATIGETVYLGLQGSRIPPIDFNNTIKFHTDSSTDRFGNGILDTTIPWVGSLHRVIDDGCIPPIDSGFGSDPGAFPLPEDAVVVNGAGYPISNPIVTNILKNVSETDTDYYSEAWGPVGVGESLEFTFHYVLNSPYSSTDVLNEAIAVARAGPAIKGGQGSTGCYHEQGGGNNIAPVAPYARSSFAFGNSLWQAGWGIQNLNIADGSGDAPKPWDGHQHHVTYKTTDAGDVYNLDGVKLGQGNKHKAYLVSLANKVQDIDFPNVVRVLCSTFSGSGALGTYENVPLGAGKFWPVRVSVADIVADNLALNPGYPTFAGATSRWQIFFPGKKASDVPPPSSTPWD